MCKPHVNFGRLVLSRLLGFARPFRVGSLLLPAWLGIATLPGCRFDADTTRNRYLDNADQYRAHGKYREAIIEYRNALGLKRDSRRANAGLGICYYELGDLRQAFRFLLSSRQLEDGNREVRMRLGMLHHLAGFARQARREAAWVIESDPHNLDALVLLAEASSRPSDIDDAILCLESVRPAFKGRSRFLLALGSLYVRKHDAGSADMLFAEAIDTPPREVEDHLALGNFFITAKDLFQAEEQFRIAASLAPAVSPARIKLADFYALRHRNDQAKQILREIVARVPDHSLAWRRLGELAFAERDYKETQRALDRVLGEDPADPDGMLLLGRLHLARGDTQAAIQAFQVVVLKLEEWGPGPKLADTRYELARSHIQAGNWEQAKVELAEANKAMPEFDEARMLLAEIEIRTRNLKAAFDLLNAQIARTPGLARAHELLGTALMENKEAAQAITSYRRFCELSPADARGPFLLGAAHRAVGNTEAAREQFESALAKSPEFIKPMEQLVAMSFAEQHPEKGVERIRAQIAKVPNSAALYQLLGATYFARREHAAAEGAYLRAVEIDPMLTDAYIRLGDLYATNRQYDQAIDKMEKVLKTSPDNLSALMILGVVYQQTEQMVKAEKAYERVLKVRPLFAAAANNLATIYLEYRKDPEAALRYAQRARELAPEDPYIADTLGWILHSQGLHRAAVGMLKESAAKLDANPHVQYHLGMAYYDLEEKDSARKALTQALALDGRFSEADVARRTLAKLEKPAPAPVATP